MALDCQLNWRGLAAGALGLTEQLSAGLHGILGAQAGSWALRVESDSAVTLTGDRHGLIGADALAQRLDGRWLIILPTARPAAVVSALTGLDAHGGNGYTRLEEAGVLLVAPDKDSTMSGGSFSQVRLEQHGERLYVAKTVRHQAEATPDVDLRLRAERDWLHGLPEAARASFPSMIDLHEDSVGLGYVSEFFPGYTLSERIFHDRLDPAAAADVIARVLDTNMRVLYRAAAPSGLAVPEDPYTERLARRYALLQARLSNDLGPSLRAAISAPELIVNGRRCTGLAPLLSRLSGEGWLDRLDARQRPELTHGDLILDDIAVSADGSRYALLDPSGAARSRIYDIGKLSLSLISYYEFFKYNQFTVTCEPNEGVTAIQIELADEAVRSAYDRVARSVPGILRESGVLDEVHASLDGIDLLLLNGIQNLALPMFHMLHHHREERALAFFALGVLRLNQYAACLDGAPRPSLSTVYHGEFPILP